MTYLRIKAQMTTYSFLPNSHKGRDLSRHYQVVFKTLTPADNLEDYKTTMTCPSHVECDLQEPENYYFRRIATEC